MDLKEFNLEQYTDLVQHYATLYGLKLLGAIAIFVIGKWLVGRISKVLHAVLTRSKMDSTLAAFFENIIYILLMVVVILAALGNLGIETTSFIAILGAAGLAISLSLQGTLGNVGSGVMLIIFRPFKVGDFISAAGEMGKVESISLFATTLITPDNKVIILPNGSVAGGNITNFSAKETRRLEFIFGIGYDDDLRKAKALLEEIVQRDERVLKDPEYFVGVGELGDSSVNFTVRVWVKREDYWPVHFDTIEKVKLSFDEQGISIPYPQMDVHLNKLDDAA